MAIFNLIIKLYKFIFKYVPVFLLIILLIRQEGEYHPLNLQLNRPLEVEEFAVINKNFYLYKIVINLFLNQTKYLNYKPEKKF